MISIIDSSESLWLECRYRIKFDRNIGEDKALRRCLNNHLEQPETVIRVRQISEVGPWLYDVVQIVYLEYPDLTRMKGGLVDLWSRAIGPDIQRRYLDFTLEWSKKVDRWYAEII